MSLMHAQIFLLNAEQYLFGAPGSTAVTGQCKHMMANNVFCSLSCNSLHHTHDLFVACKCSLDLKL